MDWTNPPEPGGDKKKTTPALCVSIIWREKLLQLELESHLVVHKN